MLDAGGVVAAGLAGAFVVAAPLLVLPLLVLPVPALALVVGAGEVMPSGCELKACCTIRWMAGTSTSFTDPMLGMLGPGVLGSVLMERFPGVSASISPANCS